MGMEVKTALDKFYATYTMWITTCQVLLEFFCKNYFAFFIEKRLLLFFLQQPLGIPERFTASRYRSAFLLPDGSSRAYREI